MLLIPLLLAYWLAASSVHADHCLQTLQDAPSLLCEGGPTVAGFQGQDLTRGRGVIGPWLRVTAPELERQRREEQRLRAFLWGEEGALP